MLPCHAGGGMARRDRRGL